MIYLIISVSLFSFITYQTLYISKQIICTLLCIEGVKEFKNQTFFKVTSV